MSHLVDSSIPPLYQNWSVEDMVGADNIDEIIQKVAQYLADPDLEKLGKNLYLFSRENGTGKTSLAYYILNQLKQPRMKTRNGIYTMESTSIVSVKFANYLKFCLDPFGQDSKYAKKLVETAPILLFDDVSPWALSSNPQKDQMELVLLMMYRREHLLPTIVTSNILPDKFNKVFGGTVTSKVLENFSYIEIRGKDVRPALFPDQFDATPHE